MRRRDLLFTAAGFTGVCSEGAQITPKTFSRSFNLLLSPAEFLQHLLAGDRGLHYVAHHRSTQVSSLGCTAFDGTVKFLWPLPSGLMYSGLGIRRSGALVLPCINRAVGREIREFSPTGTPMRTLALKDRRGVLTYCTAGDALVMLWEDGSIYALDLNSQGTRSLGRLWPDPHASVVYALSEDRVLIVDRRHAQICELDLDSGSKKFASISSPDILSSKEFFDQELTGQKATGKARGYPLMITPGQPDVEGNFYCVVNPIMRKEGALTLRVSTDGRILERFHIALPDEGTQKGIPAHLTVQSGQLFVVFMDGGVLVYDLSHQ